MSTKRLATTALFTLLAAPMLSHADAPSNAIDSCVKAFLSASEFSKERKVSIVKYATPQPLALSGRYSVEVVARGRKSGTEISRAVCQADSRGNIIALNGQPLEAPAQLSQR